MAQITLIWLGTAHAPLHSFIIGWQPPGHALPWGSVGFKGSWKRKACSLCWWTPPVPTVPSAFSSLSSLGRTGDSPFLNKAMLLHPIHMLCLDFSIWSTKTRIFWSQTAPAALTFGEPARRNWLVRSQYAISANLYCNPSFSVLWYHTSPPDALEPNKTHSLGGMGLSPWGTHPMLGTCLEAQCEPNPDCQYAAFCQEGSQASNSTPGHRVHVWVSSPCVGGWTTFPCLTFPNPQSAPPALSFTEPWDT
jgi:hypothetical protein